MEPAIANAFSAAWTLRLPRGRSLELDERPRVMGILNLTPDSFSDGGQWPDPDRAVARALTMIDQGAELLDLGAESTRPGGGIYGSGAETIPAEEEWERLAPVLRTLRDLTDLPLSVDTRKGFVAERAIGAGADLINDVGGLSDPSLALAVARADCPVILMHSRGEIQSMQVGIHFADVVSDVRRELAAVLARATDAGIAPGQVVLDPGIGFGKTWEQNLELIARLEAFTPLGRPLLLGASRKSFLAKASLRQPGVGREPGPTERLGGSLATAAWAVRKRISLLRVHDVAETVQFLAVWSALAEREGTV